MPNRFADFKWTDDQVNQGLTRADTLALLDQLSLSLTKRAYILQATETTAAAVVGHIATALQDLRCELYTRMQTESTNGTADTSVMAAYGDAPTTRTTYKPYGGTGNLSLRAVGKRLMSAAVKRAGW